MKSMTKISYMKKLREFILTNYYLYRKETSFFQPKLTYIEPTNNCVMKCYMCPSRIGHRKKGFMTLDVYKKIIDDMYNYNKENPSQVPSEQRIYLQGQGEPLISKDIFNMIEYAKKNKFKTGFSTTGAILTKEKSQKLIKAGIDTLEISCYSLNKNGYIKIHGKDMFDASFKNMIRFMHLNKKKSIPIKANILESVRSHRELDFINYLYDSLPFYSYSHLKIENFHGILNDLKLFEEINYLSFKEIKLMHNKPRLLKILYRWNYKKPRARIGDCLWLSTLVNWNGNVTPCNTDYQTRYVAGNVKNDNICSIWNNEKYRSFRRSVINDKYNSLGDEKFCNYCSHASLVRTPFFSNYIKNLAKFNIIIKNLLKAGCNKQMKNDMLKKYVFLEKYFPLDKETSWLQNLKYLKKEFYNGRILKEDLYELEK